MGLNVFGNMLMGKPVYFIFLARTPKQPCKLAWNSDLPKSILHGMTLFVLRHDSFCNAMEKCFRSYVLPGCCEAHPEVKIKSVL